MENFDSCSLNILIQFAYILNPFSLAAGICFIITMFLLLCSALISGSEIAFFSLNPSQLHELKNNNTKRNKIIIKLLETPKKLLATILIANNFINVAIVILSAFIINKTFDFSGYQILGFIIQVIVITAIILLFGEIMPKMYATQNAVIFANFMSSPIRLLLKILHPLSLLLVNSTSIIDKRISKKAPDISIDELSKAIDITANKEDTQQKIEEKKILKGIVKFGDIDVKEIMKARIDVTAINEEINFKDLLKIILESGFSRIPVYKDNFDTILGIIYIKDLVPYLENGKEFNWIDKMKPAFFVPENKKINVLLKEFQEKKIHLAIVVDEYGGTSGIVTLEDIIEEIVGEISDEFDKETDDFIYSKIDDNNYIFEGKTTLNDLYKIIGIEDYVFDDIKGESDTIAGLILELEGKIPEKNEIITYQNFQFKIIATDNRRIKKIKITINDKNKI